MKTTINHNIQHGNNLYGLSRVLSAFTTKRINVLLFSLNVILSTHSWYLVEIYRYRYLCVSIEICFNTAGSLKTFIPSTNVDNSCQISALCILTRRDHFKDRSSATSIRCRYTVSIQEYQITDHRIHVWDSGFLGDKLRDKFEAGARDAVIWPELTTVCFFNPSHGEFSGTVDHVRTAAHSSHRPTNTFSCWLCCAEPLLCCTVL
jgi:hypothetical protein